MPKRQPNKFLVLSLLFATTLLPGSSFFDTLITQLRESSQSTRYDLSNAVPGEVIVRFNDNIISDAEVESFGFNHNLKKLRKIGANIIQFKSSIKIEQTLFSLNSDPNIAYAEPNYLAMAFGAPSDPYFQYQWNFTVNKLNLPAVWEQATGEGTVIAVVDTGIAYEDHGIYRRASDLLTTNFTDGYNVLTGSAHANDDNGHGTHVTGTIAQNTNNGTGTAGIAYNATIMPVKVLDRNGTGTYAAIAEGIIWAVDHGAQVVNLSLGGPSHSKMLEDAVTYANSRGAVVVAAAGNDGRNGVSYPAAYDSVISVGALDINNQRTSYSNYGAGLDVMAYGGDLRQDRNSDGFKDGILQQTFSGNPTNFGYYFFQGTSMAAPHVSAAAALLIEHGIADPEIITAKIRQSARDLGKKGYDIIYGFGLINLLAMLESLKQDQNSQILPDQSAQVISNTSDPQPVASNLLVKVASVNIVPEYSIVTVRATAMVLVTDYSGNPITGASVSGYWGGLLTGKAVATTGPDGVAKLNSRVTFRRIGEITFTVSNISGNSNGQTIGL